MRFNYIRKTIELMKWGNPNLETSDGLMNQVRYSGWHCLHIIKLCVRQNWSQFYRNSVKKEIF